MEETIGWTWNEVKGSLYTMFIGDIKGNSALGPDEETRGRIKHWLGDNIHEAEVKRELKRFVRDRFLSERAIESDEDFSELALFVAWLDYEVGVDVLSI